MNQHRDTEFSHGYLNYLFSLLQGKIAALNMLEQLEMSTGEDLQTVRSSLDRVAGWLKDLWDGVCILSLEWTSPNTYEAKELLVSLGQIQEELRLLRDDMAAVYAMNLQIPLDQEVRGFLIAALGRATYSKDNYLRGLKKLAEFCNHKDSAESTTRLIEEHESEVQLIHGYLQQVTTMTSEDFVLDNSLLQECGVLRGKFGCQVHDLSQMLAHFQGGFSYEQSEIPFEEHGDWKSLGAPAVEAGYWHAYGFSARESITWRQIGVRDHNIAGLWVALGFNPGSAAAWHFAGFHPRHACNWERENYIPEQALELVRLGFRGPAAVPAEVEERVRAEINKPFGEKSSETDNADSASHDYWSTQEQTTSEETEIETTDNIIDASDGQNQP